MFFRLCLFLSMTPFFYAYNTHVFQKITPKLDIYTGKFLRNNSVSIEHIIPRRFFLQKKDADDVYNLAMCDIKINQIRSDFRFGSEKPQQDNQQRRLILNSPAASVLIVDKKRRTFYPLDQADKGLIARSIMIMLYKYPYLYCYLMDIIDSPETLWRWSLYPESMFERQRNQLMQNNNFKKE